MELHSSDLVALDFFQSVDENYGVSIEDPVPSDVTSVVVPELNFCLQGHELNQLV